MNDCQGILGKIFGHKFKSYEKGIEFTMPGYTTITISGSEFFDKFIKENQIEHLIACSRCGKELK